jgi:hypothetical protein
MQWHLSSPVQYLIPEDSHSESIGSSTLVFSVVPIAPLGDFPARTIAWLGLGTEMHVLGVHLLMLGRGDRVPLAHRNKMALRLGRWGALT